jgi:hypothetical protein
MLELKCETIDTAPITAMTPFQGDLKKRSQADIDMLAESLMTEGLLMPFALWRAPDNRLMLLDGHGRYEAIIRIALKDSTVLTQDFPVTLIKAETEEAARKALLQIVSTYGRITKKGVLQFTQTIPSYKAPVIRVLEAKPVKVASVQSDYVVLRVRVPSSKVEQLTTLLKQVSGLEVY